VCNWLSIADVAFVVATSAAIMAVIWSKHYSVEQLGLALTYCFLVPMFASWIGQLINMLLMMFTSLERLVEYKSVRVSCVHNVLFCRPTRVCFELSKRNLFPFDAVYTWAPHGFRSHKKRLGRRTLI
jgi:ABC-type multidrug transport system fused ATPase/permease subunit